MPVLTSYRKLRHLAQVLHRPDLPPGDRALHVVQQLLYALHLDPYVRVQRRVAFELLTPPKVLRGLRDLLVRAGTRADVDGLCAVEDTPALLVHQRLDRGDRVYVGQLGGRILCHAWFHRGPQPFDEDQAQAARWGIERDCYWSYAAATTPDSRASGVFVKVFQTALNELFQLHGATQVRCLVRHSNAGSILLHERLGFRRLGQITSLRTPLFRWLLWEGPHVSRSWLWPAAAEVVVRIPPVRAAAGAEA